MRQSLPNILTLSRIVVIPFFIAGFALDAPAGAWVTFGLFAAASVTDWFDGWLARRWGVVSAVGRFLDPIADKLLVTAALLMLVADGRAHPLPALIILCREILISGLREHLAGDRIAVPVSKLAKWKTTVQMIAIAILLLLPALGGWAWWAGETLLWLAAALTVVTGWSYMQGGMRHLLAADRR
ncbi:MAG: CDP-diacylglycerol--glycerol-3-phosphate 3-phosphatidyltransferase [Tistrella sp.]|jgi:cardiolipin synthase|uniref:CDP-diacylglycerol--glycerol-3-phosphate 3-phosphatidyltransferase n=2 Tax=Tistrella mobilis TaxID=171437 RepID=I3TVF3_TISMK|nr:MULTISPECIES: CDP-diacylglycerol--glycerol-3-phosphate 3-phosphatidyltransferase [Tistrella]AFK56741.1 Phosphatidylglycerophosphate synthase [Tistrella mobilis KA081020-065]MAD40674.1 CDP-diacylglycerol--glycerol-3-phosphate 3-phosphatidyltransferase [Tistrella sp.]MBA78851.1 CDP-diacylglycerol--glycerol-3-phosphate 3-phosphatidyltransferase [Tistrella sp.]HAE46675.1 CDP-diacylglycerol--glycerol-3-phosphate 3-phosphatidyltransferase [Tistrella mobilis]